METMLAEINLFSAGLVLIVISWIIQIVYMILRGEKMHWSFALLQLIGIVFLIYYLGVNSDVRDLSYYLQILSGVGAFGALMVILLKKGK